MLFLSLARLYTVQVYASKCVKITFIDSSKLMEFLFTCGSRTPAIHFNMACERGLRSAERDKKQEKLF